jgi:hypothetical protein
MAKGGGQGKGPSRFVGLLEDAVQWQTKARSASQGVCSL